MKRLVILAAVGLLAWITYSLLPNDEKKIRTTLANLVRTVSFGPDDGNIELLVKSERLISYFTEDLVIEVEGWPREIPNISNKIDLSQAFLILRRGKVNRLEIHLADLLVKVSEEEETATVFTSALMRINDAKDPFAQELKFTLQKVEGRWLINHVHAIQTLQ